MGIGKSQDHAPLPHNCSDILKHADLPFDISATSIQEVLYSGVFLNKKRQIANLSPGRPYEVVFVVMLNDPAYGWEVPVNLRLILPDGSRQERKENLMEKPRGKWIEIPAGEIKSSTEKTGEMEFSLYKYGGKWKGGLVIKGVKIQPKA